ncbi:hypothetical protein BGX24_003931 [Mortierella sp. AD032]|nr:hypothetical protein BGX24_003931 [Mortierella sp. AD032]
MIIISKAILSAIGLGSSLILSVMTLQTQAAPASALTPALVPAADTILLDAEGLTPSESNHAAYLRTGSACKARCYVSKFDEAGHHDLGLELDRCVAEVSAAQPKSKEGVFNRNNNPYCFLQVKDRLSEEEAKSIHFAWAMCIQISCIGY